MVILSEPGRARLADYFKSGQHIVTVNEWGNRRVGLVPLSSAHDLYVAGEFLSEDEARAAAKELGTPAEIGRSLQEAKPGSSDPKSL